MGEPEEIIYSEEELAEIENLTSFFNNPPGTVATNTDDEVAADLNLPVDAPEIGAGLDDDDDDFADPVDFSTSQPEAEPTATEPAMDDLGDLDLGDLLDDAGSEPADDDFSLPDFTTNDPVPAGDSDDMGNLDDLEDATVPDPLDLDNLGQNIETPSISEPEATEETTATPEEVDLDLPDLEEIPAEEASQIDDIPVDIAEVADLTPEIEEEPVASEEVVTADEPAESPATEPTGEQLEEGEILPAADSDEFEESTTTDDDSIDFSLDEPPPMDMAADVTDANSDPVVDDLDMMSQGIAPAASEEDEAINIDGDEVIPDISDLDTIDDEPSQPAETPDEEAAPANTTEEETEDYYSDLESLPSAPDLSSLNPALTSINAIKVTPEERATQASLSTADIEPLSNMELQKLRTVLREYSAGLRQSIITAILEDKLFPEETEQLLKKILKDEPEESIKEFLERLLGEYVAEDEETLRTKMIASRPEYTTEGMERQAKLLKFTRIGSIAAISLLFVSTLLYQVGLKPMIYRGLVQDGKEVILNNAPQTEAVAEAEAIFAQALDYYPQRNYAFLQYADAYKRKGMYEAAFKKLFGDIEPAARLVTASLRPANKSADFWKSLKKVPIVNFSQNEENVILLNETAWYLHKPGAYLIETLYKDQLNAETLIALGKFHSNHVRRFRSSAYRNNELGIDYLERVLNFDTESPGLNKEDLINRSILSIGDIYYHQRDFYRALDYYEKIIKKDPTVPSGQAGVVKTLLRLFSETDDPRLVLQQHSMIKHQLDIETKMPLYLLSQLAAFYIDLPNADDLRIRFNVSPADAVNGRQLKERASELLDLIFKSTQEDEYGNVIRGPEFAEGYYQRGRFYRQSAGMMQMAMKQMEYAFRYNPRHFLALNERAEMLMDLEDYEGAIEHLKEANIMVQPERLAELGDQPEDETLLEADHGIVPFNLGKAMYLSLVKDLGNFDPWTRINETDRFRSSTDSGIEGLKSMLNNVEVYFDQAKAKGIKNEPYRIELYYYSGWSKYVKNDFRAALAEWEQIPVQMQNDYRNLNLAKSHALYKLSTYREGESREKYLKASLGYLSLMRDHYNKVRSRIGAPDYQNRKHIELYMRSAVLENNMGAIFEMLGDEENSQQHYWKSIDFSKQVKRENEVSNLNLKLSFRRDGLTGQEKFPIIMDFIPPRLKTESY